ncbi:hypothetical protein [Evansella clarkii]|uniref:hypothetical protein n=1 Tax=Evansella clarkii TaxID=79879 RepID=UPI0010657CD3|nr:hypothetical protein [Evansella clarkii]
MINKIKFLAVTAFCLSIIFITLGSTAPVQADDDFGIIFPESKSRLVDTDIEDESGSWGPDGPGGFFPGGIDNVNPPGAPDPGSGDPGSGHPGYSGDPNHPDYDDRSFWERLRDFGRDLWDGAVEAGRDLGELASDTWDYITDPDGLRADAASFGEWLLDGLVDAITATVDWFADTMSSVGEWFSDAWDGFTTWLEENQALLKTVRDWLIITVVFLTGVIVFGIIVAITAPMAGIIAGILITLSATAGIIYGIMYAGTDNFSILSAITWITLPLLGFGGIKLFAGSLLARGLAGTGGILAKAFAFPAAIDLAYNLTFNMFEMSIAEMLFSAVTTGLLGVFTLGLGKAVLGMPTISKKVGTLLFGGILGGSGNYIINDFFGEASLGDFLLGASLTMAFSIIVTKYIPQERQEGGYELLIEGIQRLIAGTGELFNKVRDWVGEFRSEKKEVKNIPNKYNEQNSFENKYYGP